MKVQVQYWNQLRLARGLNEEAILLKEGATLNDLLLHIGQQAELQSMLFDSQGGLSPWILIDCAGTMVRDPTLPMSDGLEVQLLTHISGG